MEVPEVATARLLFLIFDPTVPDLKDVCILGPLIGFLVEKEVFPLRNTKTPRKWTSVSLAMGKRRLARSSFQRGSSPNLPNDHAFCHHLILLCHFRRCIVSTRSLKSVKRRARLSSTIRSRSHSATSYLFPSNFKWTFLFLSIFLIRVSRYSLSN